jgi:hypothetical protein
MCRWLVNGVIKMKLKLLFNIAVERHHKSPRFRQATPTSNLRVLVLALTKIHCELNGLDEGVTTEREHASCHASALIALVATMLNHLFGGTRAQQKCRHCRALSKH